MLTKSAMQLCKPARNVPRPYRSRLEPSSKTDRRTKPTKLLQTMNIILRNTAVASKVHHNHHRLMFCHRNHSHNHYSSHPCSRPSSLLRQNIWQHIQHYISPAPWPTSTSTFSWHCCFPCRSASPPLSSSSSSCASRAHVQSFGQTTIMVRFGDNEEALSYGIWSEEADHSWQEVSKRLLTEV